MGLLRLVAGALLVGGVVVALDRGQAPDAVSNLAAAGEPARAALGLCRDSPALCAAMAGLAADEARREALRRFAPAPAAEIRQAPVATASVPLPPRRPRPERTPPRLTSPARNDR